MPKMIVSWNLRRTARWNPARLARLRIAGRAVGFTSQPIDLSCKMSTFETTDIGRLVSAPHGPGRGSDHQRHQRHGPKDAQKAYEKGHEKATKQKWDEAQQSLGKAVQIYPKYAIAWYELGRLQLHKSEAQPEHVIRLSNPRRRSQVRQSLSRFSRARYPTEAVAAVGGVTDQLLALDPISFPDAWYAIRWDIILSGISGGEKSARQGIKVTIPTRCPSWNICSG